MPAKTALLFADENCIKIVYGKIVKEIKFSEVKAPHNVKFIDQLFESTTVVVIDAFSELTKESYFKYVEEFSSIVAKEEQKKEEPREAVVAPAGTAKKLQSKILAEAEAEADSELFRSLEETTIIIDDLPTGEEIPGLPGVKKTLAIHPYKAIDFATLPKESVKNSAILKRLIRNKILVPCSREEALQLQEEYERKIRQENDDRLDHASPILAEKAEDFVARTVTGMGNISELHDAETINIDEGPTTRQNSGDTMSDLMRLVGAADEGPAAEAQPLPKRPLAARPATLSSGIKAKGINKL